MASTGAKVVLGNTYHLWLRPGPELIAGLGGLHGFTRWPHAMLTDSGGFQAYSLGAAKEGARALVIPDDDGFTFRSHLDGSKHHLSPEEAVRVQGLLGADIQMQLDVCPPGQSRRPALLVGHGQKPAPSSRLGRHDAVGVGLGPFFNRLLASVVRLEVTDDGLVDRAGVRDRRHVSGLGEALE